MRLSAYKITDFETLPFSAKQYSIFKFGSKSVAHQFGKQLFNRFKDHLFATYGAVLRDKVPQIVVCSAPYNHIPTATGAMKDYFVKYLNEYLATMGAPVVQETKVHRNTTYREDYGSMSKEQRLALIGGDTFHMDLKFMCNKLVLFLDDVRITGSHEEVMIRTANINLSSDTEDRFEQLDQWCKPMFLYFAELDNPDCCPTIENDLNFASIKNVFDIFERIKDDDFLFNTRVVKYILNSPELDAITFLQWQTKGFLDTLYHLAIGNSYHLVPEYQANLEHVKNLLDGNTQRT